MLLLLTIITLVALAMLMTYAIGLVWWVVAILGLLLLATMIFHAYQSAINSGPKVLPDITFWALIIFTVTGVYLLANTPLSRNLFDNVQIWTIAKAKGIEEARRYAQNTNRDVVLHDNLQHLIEEEIPNLSGIVWKDDLITFPSAPHNYQWGILVSGKALKVKGDKHLIPKTLSEVKVFYIDTALNKSSRSRILTKS